MSFVQNYLIQSGSALVDTSTGIAGLAASAVWSGDATWSVSEVMDSAYLFPAGSLAPTKVLKVTCTAAGASDSSYRLEWSVNVTANTFNVITSFTRGENLGGQSQVGDFRLGQESGFTNYWVMNEPHSASSGYESKWYVPAQLLSSPNSTSGSPNLGNSIVRVRRILGAKAGTTPTYYIGPIRINTVGKPQIVITLDDGNVSDYETAFAYMQDRGLVGSCAINSSSPGMTVAQMQEMQAARWSFHNHLETHTNMTTMTAADMRDEIETCRAWLRRYDLDSGAQAFILPNGARNTTVDSVVAEYYPYTLMASGETKGFPTWGGIYNPRQVDRVSMDAPTSSATIIGYINSAVHSGHSLILFGHDVQESAPNNSTDLATFQAVVQHIARLRDSNVVDNRNLNEFFLGLTSPRHRRIAA